MPNMPDQYYNRHDPAKHYDLHLFRSGHVLQSAELNEIQSGAAHRLQGVADALFRDGDLIRDARIIVESGTGVTTCEAGALYLKGAVRGVAPRTITIPVTGTITVGVYLVETVVTDLEDAALRDPATGTRNYQEPGAARLKAEPIWGYAGDGQDGEFYPVYTVDDGIVRAKEPPPQIDSVTQAIARYDRDNSGGTYIVSGMAVSQAADLSDGSQCYIVNEGRARVNGFAVQFDTGRRVVYSAAPDTRLIDSEPHISTTAGAQRIDLDRTPVGEITQVRITAEKTVTLTHGGFTGAQDPLPDTSVLSILDVHQGGTTYVNGTDYKLTAGKVDWSLAGAEVAPGTTYSVTYQYITSVEPTLVDETGCTVTSAVVDSLILVNYTQLLPRIDRLCLDKEGALNWLQGVSAEWNPQSPSVPPDVIGLATVHQTWTASRRIVSDGIRVVPMNDLAAINARLDTISALLAQQRLTSDIHLREAGAKKGLFVDPFMSDEQRDPGIVQTAAIVNGELTLPIAATVAYVGADIAAPRTLTHTATPVLEQLARTGSMKINPYLSFAPIPAVATLTPCVDRWTLTDTAWASSITRRFSGVTSNAANAGTVTTTSTALVSSQTVALESLRQIDVQFSIAGFGPYEELGRVTFDDIDVVPTNI